MAKPPTDWQTYAVHALDFYKRLYPDRTMERIYDYTGTKEEKESHEKFVKKLFNKDKGKATEKSKPRESGNGSGSSHRTTRNTSQHEKWCGRCRLNNHNFSECRYKDMSSQEYRAMIDKREKTDKKDTDKPKSKTTYSFKKDDKGKKIQIKTVETIVPDSEEENEVSAMLTGKKIKSTTIEDVTDLEEVSGGTYEQPPVLKPHDRRTKRQLPKADERDFHLSVL